MATVSSGEYIGSPNVSEIISRNVLGKPIVIISGASRNMIEEASSMKWQMINIEET